MENESNKLNWEDIMNRFSTYQGRIVDFCKENKIKPNQLYHRRKRLEKEKNQSFHAISIKKEETVELPSKIDTINKSNAIKIEIGKATLFIPFSETSILSDIIKELVKTC